VKLRTVVVLGALGAAAAAWLRSRGGSRPGADVRAAPDTEVSHTPDPVADLPEGWDVVEVADEQSVDRPAPDDGTAA
jgi:hypothetical protein